MWDQIGRLHAHHGDVSVEVRLLKLTEEVGEAAEAFSAAVAMTGITGDVNEARAHFERRLALVTERAGL